ncbi:MAG: hypothetical protein K2Q32_07685 [Alphaproteobacteria bacterium]|nr:hypothetical protein [Alphaproteobacteria bacterium]
MKRIQNTARNIFIMDDEAAFGSRDDETAFGSRDDETAEQPQTAPIETIPEKSFVHPLRGLLTSALRLISSSNNNSDEPSIDDYDADELTRHDDLISLYDDEEVGQADTLSTAVSVLDSIADSLNGQNDGVKAPMFLSAFKSRFMR